jgi:hypothetical protein
MTSKISALFKRNPRDPSSMKSATEKVLLWEKILCAMAKYQAETREPTPRTEIFMAKNRITGRVSLRQSLQADLQIMRRKGFLEIARRSEYLVTPEGHKYVRQLKKRKNVKF